MVLVPNIKEGEGNVLLIKPPYPLPHCQEIICISKGCLNIVLSHGIFKAYSTKMPASDSARHDKNCNDRHGNK